MLQPQRGPVLASAPVWVSHTSLRWVIAAGRRAAAPGGMEGKQGTFSWILVSFHGVSTSPGAGGTSPMEGCTLSLSPPTREPKPLGFPHSQVEFHWDSSSRKPGMLVLALGSARWLPQVIPSSSSRKSLGSPHSHVDFDRDFSSRKPAKPVLAPAAALC